MFSPQMSPAALGAGAQAYRTLQVETQITGGASPHRLIAMLYDGFFEALTLGRAAMRNRDIEAKNKHLAKAVRIVEEGLRASLNKVEGGRLARDLDELYGYVAIRVTRANLRNDEAGLDECAKLMQPLREAWASIRAAVES